jgi:TonB family protein
MKKLLVGLLLCAAITVTKQTSAQTKPDSVYQRVDIKPQYTGGETALENFILAQTQYPQEALNKKQEGIIEVDFILSKNGNITDIKCTNNKYPELCNEVKRVIALMPKWTPAKVKGQTVNVHHKMSIGFKLYNKQITYVIIPDETTVSIDELIEQDIVDSDPNGVDSELLSKPKRQSDEDILTFAEQMPEFDGDLSEYLSKNISYPKIAAENKIEGKVIVQFVVEKDGSISNASVIRKVGWGMDEEALRVVSNMPTWKPGKQNGKPIRVKYNLPVNFKLK